MSPAAPLYRSNWGQIEYRFADGQYDPLPALAMDLIGRHVAVIIFAGARNPSEEPAWRSLRASNIPIVFNGVGDPVGSGLVSSFNRPGGNITGIVPLNTLMGKHMGLLHELVPDAKTIAVLANNPQTLQSVNPQTLQSYNDEARKSAATLGVQLFFLFARSEGEIDAAFAAMNQQRAEALVVVTSPFFVTRAKLIASLADRYRLPAIYSRREYAEAGGLMSYGYDVADGYRLMGGYAGRILKGDKPADLSVFQPTKFPLVINLKTAKAVGITVPATLLALANEVIETPHASIAANSSRSSAARRHGRSRHTRSRATGCGASACSCRSTKTIPSRSVASLRSRRRLRAWVGPMAATCGWTFVGRALTPVG
jgi:putative ABC transport system substrate-binding protein